MSTGQIMRMAAARIINLESRTVDVEALFKNPFDLCLSRISYEDARNVELVEYVLAAAEKVGNRQFELAAELLRLCDCLSSPAGNPVQRVAHYFSRALREKIARGTGMLTAGEEKNRQQPGDFQNGAVQALYEKIPFCQVAHLAVTQVVLEHVSHAKRIHVIDLRIRNGMQWIPLMQALASSQCDRHVEILKITAVGTTAGPTTRRDIEDTGRRLTSFAKAMNLMFEFKVVMVSVISDVQDDMFDLDPREATAVYSEFYLRKLVGTGGPASDQMDKLMATIRAIGPRVMVVVEAEANHNSSNYARRFVDALFHYGALFDCIGECMVEPNDSGRVELESRVLAGWIRNIVAAEGEERKIRSVTMDVWRTLLARFGLGEAKMSALVLYQVGWVLGRFSCGRFCKVDINGKSIVIGWKGTPIVSISAWKFSRPRKQNGDDRN
ncbi:unnamed protein product [Linum tenue]|uniref:Uncharacterized protein n=4 Tax=Linum tenue TaxID=586396 RepID=A0AAV0P907_9ROSI|nr:unnamed protein product [Linum tenue]